jgi:hypothetical protein
VKNFATHPQLRTWVDALGAFGYDHYRKIVVRQRLNIHMFIPTNRDS